MILCLDVVMGNRHNVSPTPVQYAANRPTIQLQFTQPYKHFQHPRNPKLWTSGRIWPSLVIIKPA